jgi:drug/metabolite transporter (DMT)-like permease
VSRKGLWLFIACGIAWGIPYAFIRVAVEQFDVATIIFARVVIGAAVLIPFAIHRKAIMPALKHWPWVLAFALIEMAGPWFLITNAEKTVSSGLTGLLIAIVPFWAVFIAYWFLGDKSVKHPKTIFGLVIGFIGVFLLVGIDAFTADLDILGVGAVVLASLGYAIAPAISSHKIGHIDSAGVISLSMVIVAAIYAVPGLSALPAALPHATFDGWFALAMLGIVCSAIAFILFFDLIKEIGSARATLITYPNTAIAFVLGIVFLSEPITLGMILGFPLVLIGSYFASKKH